MANKATEEELHNIRKWINPKAKVRRCFKIEESQQHSSFHVEL